MDLPVLSSDAEEAIHRARGTAGEHGRKGAALVDILIALLDSQQAVRLLEQFEPEPEKVRRAALFLTQHGAARHDPDAEERIVHLARSEAGRMGHGETGPEHLVLALAREAGSLAGGILESIGLTLDPAREAVRYLHGQVPDWQPPTNRLSSATLTLSPIDSADVSMSEADAARMLDTAMVNFEIGMSRLHRVVAIGQALEASGVLVEMIALEVREAGAVLLWRTQTSEDRLLGQADIAVSDDAGTAYQVMPANWSGNGRESRGETRLVPRPPDKARVLIIEVQSFGRIDRMPVWLRSPDWEDVGGPWRFDVSLMT